MFLSLVLALQAANAPAPAPPVPAQQRWAMPARTAGGVDFDLAGYRAAGGPCAGAGGDEVVVCGRRGGGGDYPMARWARIFGPERPIRAEMGLGGNLTGRIYTDAVPMDRGLVSNRVLVGIKLPF